MGHTKEEIINALKVIQNTCKLMQGSNSCERCPLSKEGTCIIMRQVPEKWQIKSNTPVWKAFE